MRLHAVPLVLAVVLSTACGSTVATGRQAAIGPNGTGTGTDGLGTTAPGVSPGTTGAGGGTSGTSGGSLSTGTTGSVVGGGSTGTGTAGGTTGGPAGTTGGSAPQSGAAPGVTAKEIYVGFIYDENAGAVNEAAGIGSITAGDSKANNRAIIDDINKHGGIGGRKLVPVYARSDSTSTQTLDQQYAAICQKFTRDNRVFAVLGAGEESYRSCISKAGVSILSDSLPTVGAAEFRRYPAFIEQGYPNVDRLAAYHVTPLVAQKYFTPWNTVAAAPAASGTAKVGILTYNDKVFAPAVDGILVPALKRLGYTPLVQKVAQVTTASDYGAQGASVKAAQLAFASNGVTHVIPFESNGGLSTLFLPIARSQGYYPRYGVNTASASEALLESGAMEARQFNGAVGYGWWPSVDLPRDRNPATGPYSNANRRYCLKVMKDNNITFDSGNAESIALSSCAALYLLKTVLDKTPTQITQQTFVRGVESLGTSYQKAGSLGQEFRPGRHDPTNKAYYWGFDADCTCFHYSGPIRTIP